MGLFPFTLYKWSTMGFSGTDAEAVPAHVLGRLLGMTKPDVHPQTTQPKPGTAVVQDDQVGRKAVRDDQAEFCSFQSKEMKILIFQYLLKLLWHRDGHRCHCGNGSKHITIWNHIERHMTVTTYSDKTWPPSKQGFVVTCLGQFC